MNRLHPLTPVLKGVRAFWLVVAALSWQGFAQFGLGYGAAIVAFGGVCALALSYVAWLVSGFEVVNRELRIHEGLLVRRVRAVPLERMQSIEVVRPLLAQLTGLAELRIEVVGGEKSEATLAYLPLPEATNLRQRLLALGGDDQTEVPDADDEGQLLYRVPGSELIGSQLLTPPTLLAPFALTASALMFALNPTLTFVGIAGAVTASLGTVLTPVRRVLRNYRFTLSRFPGGLRIRRGASETRAQTVPANRVQSVALVRPLLWRGPEWVRCDMHIAGVRGGDASDFSGGTLLPVASPEVARTAMEEILPGAAEATTMPLIPAPPAAKWRAPVRARTLGIGLSSELFVSRSGLITPVVMIVPYGRIQAISLDQGPWQRALGLASVRVHTAGGNQVHARYRTRQEAVWLAAELHARAAGARRV
ncbi:MAG: PH domain-containing protein [Longispora sp.]|nr:PH domain-containing protein [Longispora sp. (in: high G+C Gram-positive bacteria)]